MDFELLQGRSTRLVIGPMTKSSGQMVDLTGKRLLFVAKATMEDADPGDIVYSLTVDGGGIPTSDGIVFGRPSAADVDVMQDEAVDSGYATLEFDDNDTRAMAPGAYPYELVLVAGTRVHQLRSGTITVADTLIADPEAYA